MRDLEALADHFGGREEHRGRLREGGNKKKRLGKGGEKQGEALLAEDMSIPQMEMPIPIENKEEIKHEVVVNEKKEVSKEERIKYLATDLVSDLKVFYGPKEVDKREATKRLEKNKVKELTWVNDQKVARKDWKKGSWVANKLNDFFENEDETFFPEGWADVQPNLEIMGLAREDLLEAKRIKERPAKDEVKKNVEEPVWDERVLTDLNIATLKNNDEKDRNDAWQRLNEKGFFLKKDKSEDRTLFDAINVALSEKGDFVGAVKFLKEYFGVVEGVKQEKKEEITPKVESEAESWETKYDKDSLFQTLKKVVDKEVWQKKMEELSKLDGVTRENKLSILMALIKIKSEGIITVEGQRLWESQKNKLEELGLMI
ncbi:MAG: hypothetical protein UW48_C0006G0088 [Microgenomates group bacterium GW2011_GWC1_44_23]|nr:MAG: hypothetical protein UW48_C0006G0088 [Microgenomates group bacterium GW2011_GWC1_44_23]